MKWLPLLLSVVVSCSALRAAELREQKEFAAAFKEAGVEGTFAILDPKEGVIHVHNAQRARKRFVPASTFKIANSLIGLDSGAIRDVDEVLPYGGKPQPIAAWEKDMSLREAIKVSNVPVYQELARRIGLERMAAGVKKLGYGNQEIGTVVDRFWLDGPLEISAVEQLDFLVKLADGKLSVSEKAIKAVHEITLLEESEGYRLHGKTGWERNEKTQVGWFVGWISRDGRNYPFALNMVMTEMKQAPLRVQIAKECLKVVGKME